MEKRTTIAFFAALCLAAAPAHAQRTAKGESFIGLNGGSAAPVSTTRIGAVNYGRYLLGSYWKVGAEYNGGYQEYRSVSSDPFVFDIEKGSFDVRTYTLHADWMIRLLSSYSRGLNLYAGLGGFAGIANYGSKYPVPNHFIGEGESTTLRDVLGKEPAYGLSASFEAEVFVTRSLALTAEYRLPWTVKSSLATYFDASPFRSQFLLGIRYDFFL